MNRISLIIVYASFAIMIVGKFIFWHGHPLLASSDQAAYLEMAELITTGKLPYLDFFEWNHPLIMYLNLIPVWLGKLAHIPAIEAFNYAVITLCAFSAFISLHIASKYMNKQQFLVILPLLFAAAFFNQNQTINIGEREHLFVICYLPFFILRGLAWQGQQISKFDAVISGLVAGFGMALKPQFAASVALVELCFYCQFKTLKTFVRPEMMMVLLVFVLYIFALLLLPPSVWDCYLHQVVPLYISGLSYSSRAIIYMLRADPNFYIYFVHLLLTLPIALVYSRYNQWIAPLGIFSLSFVFHYIYGDQAWPYRFMPMTAALFMLDGLLIGMLVKTLFKRIGLSEMTGMALSIALFATASYFTYNEFTVENNNRAINTKPFDMAKVGYQGSCLGSDFDPLVFSILSQTKIDDSVIFIGNGIDPGFPAILQSGRKLGSRYLFCTLPYIDHCSRQSKEPRWSEMAESVINNYGQDIMKNKPAVIFVQQRQMDELLDQHHFFERFMSNYELAGETDLYKVWTRTGTKGSFSGRGEPAQIIIDILAKRITAEEAALESGYEREKIERWLYLARQALSHAVSKHASDRQLEIDEDIRKLNENINQLQIENAELKLKLEKNKVN